MPPIERCFPSQNGGKALAIVRALPGQKGMIQVSATTAGLTAGSTIIVAQ